MLHLSPRGRLIEVHCPQKPVRLAYSGEHARIAVKALLAVQIMQRIQKGVHRLSQAIGLMNGHGLGNCRSFDAQHPYLPGFRPWVEDGAIMPGSLWDEHIGQHRGLTTRS